MSKCTAGISIARSSIEHGCGLESPSGDNVISPNPGRPMLKHRRTRFEIVDARGFDILGGFAAWLAKIILALICFSPAFPTLPADRHLLPLS